MGIKIFPTDKGRDSVLYGIELIQEQKLNITKRSTNLLRELSKYIWKMDKEGANTNVPIDAFNHAIDALRYGIMMLLKKTRMEGVRPFRII